MSMLISRELARQRHLGDLTRGTVRIIRHSTLKSDRFSARCAVQDELADLGMQIRDLPLDHGDDRAALRHLAKLHALQVQADAVGESVLEVYDHVEREWFYTVSDYRGLDRYIYPDSHYSVRVLPPFDETLLPLPG